jgi:hypothetical protein
LWCQGVATHHYNQERQTPRICSALVNQQRYERKWAAAEVQRKMKPGIYHDIPNEDYHAEHCLSKSGMVYFDRYPAYYKWMQNHPTEATKPMLDGTQFHTAALEPTRYRNEYVVAPKCDRRTKVGKALWTEFQAENAGKIVVSQKDWDMVAGMVAAIGANEEACDLLSNCLIEQSVFWNDPEHDFPCQCRPDAMKPPYVIDLKSCQDATYGAFQRDLVKYKYHWQAAHYLNGLSQVSPAVYTEFIFIAVEKTPPYTCCVYPLDPVDVESTLMHLTDIYERFADCLETDIWPEPKQRQMSLPNYEKVKIGSQPF